VNLDGRWKPFYSGANPSAVFAQAGVGSGVARVFFAWGGLKIATFYFCRIYAIRKIQIILLGQLY